MKNEVGDLPPSNWREDETVCPKYGIKLMYEVIGGGGLLSRTKVATETEKGRGGGWDYSPCDRESG